MIVLYSGCRSELAKRKFLLLQNKISSNTKIGLSHIGIYGTLLPQHGQHITRWGNCMLKVFKWIAIIIGAIIVLLIGLEFKAEREFQAYLDAKGITYEEWLAELDEKSASEGTLEAESPVTANDIIESDKLKSESTAILAQTNQAEPEIRLSKYLNRGAASMYSDYISPEQTAALTNSEAKTFYKFAEKVEKAIDCIDVPTGYKEAWQGQDVPYLQEINSTNIFSVQFSYGFCSEGAYSNVLEMANENMHLLDKDPRFDVAVLRMQSYYEFINNAVMMTSLFME